MADHPQPSAPVDEILLLESIRDYVVRTYEIAEETQRGVVAQAAELRGFKIAVGNAIADVATLLGALQAVDPAAATQVAAVIKNLRDVVGTLRK